MKRSAACCDRFPQHVNRTADGRVYLFFLVTLRYYVGYCGRCRRVAVRARDGIGRVQHVRDGLRRQSRFEVLLEGNGRARMSVQRQALISGGFGVRSRDVGMVAGGTEGAEVDESSAGVQNIPTDAEEVSWTLFFLLCVCPRMPVLFMQCLLRL